MQYYGAKLYSNQLMQGIDYLEFCPVIMISITDYKVFNDSHNFDCINYHEIREIGTRHNVFTDLLYIFIELPKFTKKESELKTLEDHWIYFLKSKNITQPPQNLKDDIILNAYDMMDEMHWTPDEREAYLHAENATTYYNAAIKDHFEQGLAKGLEEGLAKAKEEKIRTAGALKRKGISIESIMDCIDLTKEEIEQIN